MSATVLIVEDEATIRAAIAKYLESAGYAVIQASTGREARELRMRKQGSPERTTFVAAANIVDTSLTIADLEKKHILPVLEEEEGRVDYSAQRVGISRSSHYQKIKIYGIQPRSR